MSTSSGPGPTPDLSTLSATLLADDATLADALARIASVGCGALPECTSASISIIERGRAATAGSSDPLATELDRAQYTAGDGPCLTAAQVREVIIVESPKDQRWPHFIAAATKHGVHSSMSIPIELADQRVHAGFNAYASTPGAFGEASQQIGAVFAAHAATVIANARAYWAAVDLARHLTTAMATRGVIEQAKGIIMARQGIDADAAFDELRRQSQHANRKVADIAAEMVAAVAES